MTPAVRDIQFNMQADGRTYVIELCAPGRNPAPVSAGPFDVHITIGVDDVLPEWQKAEPERVVRQVTDYVVALVPKSVRRDQWTTFADAVLAWVCEHQDAAATRG